MVPNRNRTSRCRNQILFSISTVVLLLSLIGCSSVQNYSNAQIGANETAAIQVLRNISQAQTIYFTTQGGKSFGSLQQLSDNQLISSDLAAGQRNGYRFAVRTIEPSESRRPSFEAVATPVNYGTTGTRSFYLNEEGVIRQADKNGAEATAKDPVLN